MAQWIKTCVLCEHGELSPDPQYPQKKLECEGL